MTTHQKYIKRCIQIAKNGLGNTYPNPSVGCVVVFKNKIIGEGFTSPYGGNHAEVNAINSVKDKSLLSKSDLYVTLEPCSHHGKTPPCSDFIIQNKIPRIVIGALDNNPLVSGEGIQKLAASGCKVTTGVLEAECKDHHKRFFTFHQKKRPYIILKWAESTDSFIAPSAKKRVLKKPVWISNSYSRQLVHQWRSEEHAILVGTNTVLEDNPVLTVRSWYGNNPIRVVLDRKSKIQKSAAIFNEEARTIHITSDKLKKDSSGIENICQLLYNKNIQSVLIEGGAQTLQSFINSDIWDEARVFTGPILLNDGIKAPSIPKEKKKNSILIKDDCLTTYSNI